MLRKCPKKLVMENVLLIGNGINRIEKSNSYNWEGLLEEIKNVYGINANLKNPLKPFPLSFDEMSYSKSGSNTFNSKVKNLKKKISSVFNESIESKRNGWHNDFHSKCMNDKAACRTSRFR